MRNYFWARTKESEHWKQTKDEEHHDEDDDDDDIRKRTQQS